MGTKVTDSTLTPATLRPFLADCGYQLLLPNYRFGTASGMREVALAAFAHQPTDTRSACVAAIDANGNPRQAVLAYRELGAPVVFICRQGHLQWWRQGTEPPEYLATITTAELPGFFQTHQGAFAPEVIYRAKTRGRFDRNYQLSFVDVGLMPLSDQDYPD